ncbi:hypothetical protein [Sutcliffiella halmapala]|uniref:hypothetical protein n=1 Tax=Sutcliffiella halmapala TaxID=79882 RepID=UPI0014731716|nr:hypothetical protein [Sutcliffiella halmapala]
MGAAVSAAFLIVTELIVIILHNRIIKTPYKRKKRERLVGDRALKNEKREIGGTISA